MRSNSLRFLLKMVAGGMHSPTATHRSVYIFVSAIVRGFSLLSQNGSYHLVGRSLIAPARSDAVPVDILAPSLREFRLLCWKKASDSGRIKVPIMAGTRNPRNRRLFPFALPLLLLLLFATGIFSCVSAQEEVDSEDNPSNESVKVLDRRSKIVLRTARDVDTDVDDVDSKSKLTDITGYSEVGLGLFDAFFASLSMIIVSEIGDETFIIAALMAMRHPKSIVLSGALTALVVMTVLSTALGRIVPNLISRKHTNNAATVLYAFFGLRLLYIAWRSDSKTSQKKEMEEVEEKLEGGQGKTAVRRFFSRFCTPIFLESFILTFLAEWGDRSQIATIALATHKNALGVAVGATLGHTICTSLAVIGGSILASKISQGTVATIGGLLFLCFSLSSYFYPPL